MMKEKGAISGIGWLEVSIVARAPIWIVTSFVLEHSLGPQGVYHLCLPEFFLMGM